MLTHSPRHGRACRGHPRLFDCSRVRDVDARHKAGHDGCRETSMRTAIATVCVAGTLNEKLEAMAAARFKGVEIFENDLLSFDGTPAQVGRRIRDLGLEAVTFQPFRDF